MDNIAAKNINSQPAKGNPFLTKKNANNASTIPQANKINQFFSNVSAPSLNSIFNSSISQASEDSQLENRPQNISIMSPQARLRLTTFSKEKQQKKKTANLNSNCEVLPQLQIKLSISGQLCDVNQSQFKRLRNVFIQNTSKTKMSLSLAEKKVEKITNIMNYLSKLYLVIESNNFTFLNKANKKNQGYKDYEIARLLQGLLFYKPNQKFQVLSEVLKQHIFGPQVKQISRKYNLDVLKAYYVVKQVYIQQQILSQYVSNFNVKIQENRIIDTQRLFTLVEDFLNTDKKNLLMIYGEYLTSDKKPSQGGVCSVKQEINLLWANLHMISSQNLQIQQMIFKIYRKYFKYYHREKYVYLELEIMRKRFETVNQQFSNKIVQMYIQRMLEEGQFDLSQCKGHYLDLVTFLVNKQSINFQDAILRLANVDLQLKWFQYFKAIIKELSFGRGRQQQQIKRACYLYKLCKMFYSKNIFLQKDLQEKLVKSVSVNCSIIIGLMFLELMQNRLLKFPIIKLILKFSQTLLFQKQAEDGKIIRKVLPQQYKFSNIVDLIIDFIQRTFQDFIKSGDLSLLEIQLSSGRKIIYSYFSNEAPLQIIMYYICIFHKFTSFSHKIQKNIEKLFHLLKQLNYENLNPSVRYYNDKMSSKILDSSMIASQMVFMIEMIAQPLKKIQYIEKWLFTIQRLGLNQHFDQFIIVLAKLIEDIENSPQILISVQMIQIFLNCFKDSISNFINSHTTKLNIAPKLNLLSLFIKIAEWQNMVSNQVPESIYFYKFQLKTQIQLIVNRLYDKFTIPGHTMSQKLTIIYQFITSDRSYSSNMEFSVSVFSDILARQKASTFQIYGMIAQQLKKQEGIQSLVALYYITLLEQNLAILLINQIGLYFSRSLKQQTCPSLITIQKMIKLSINLFAYFSPKFKMQQKQKLKMLFGLMQNKIYLWLKNKTMTANFFRHLFDLLCISKNSIPYQYHITYLISAKRLKLLSSCTQQQYKKMGLHMLYVLSLRMSKKSCLVDINNENQIQQLQEQLQVFTQMELNLLSHFGQDQNSKSFDQFSQRYISKFNKLLFQCSNQPLINEVANKLLRKINENLDEKISKSSNNIFLKKEKILIQKYLGLNNNLQRVTVNPKEPFHFIKCKSKKDFNQILQQNLNKLALNPENELNELQISKIISFIDNNSQHIIDFIFLSVKIIQSKPLDLLLVQLINKIISRLNPNHYGKKQNKTIIKNIVSQLTNNLSSFSDLYALRLNRQLIYTINSILQNLLISPFEISSIFSSTLGEILHILRQILFKWTACNIPSLHCLGQISLILNHYPTGTNYNKNFTLWNLIQYRQKLYFLDQILQYARQVNGLIDIKKYGIIQIVVEFTTFLVLNQINFKANQNQEKIRGVNKLLHSLPMNPKNLMNFIDKDISISQLKMITWHIIEQLNYLNFEYTSFQAEFFQNFTPTINQ